MAQYRFESPQKTYQRFANHISVSKLLSQGYEIKEEIGKGGFGIVYRAISKSTGSLKQNVAIKLVLVF
jgi:serine/threonine protein kinase